MEIQVMSSLAMKAACLELAPRFEQESGYRVLAQWVGGADIAKRLRAGEAVDLVFLAANAIDDMAKEGLIVAGSRVDLVKSRTGLAVRSGAPRPDVSSADALKRAVLAAKSVAYSSGPSGVYLAGLLRRWGMPEERMTQTAPGVPAGELVARGEAEIGFQQVSELLPVKGIDFVGALPAQIELVTVFSAGTPATATHSAAAKDFTHFLRSPTVAPVYKKHGLDPG